MKIYNKKKTEIIENPDLEKGHLEPSTIHVHEDEVQYVKEEGHYETIAEYPGGGKDVKYVVDVAGVNYQPAKDYDEDILIYVPYTKKELAEITSRKRINELKSLLASSDYKAIKYAEGELTEEEYAETKELRRSYRAEINQLEESLNN